MLPLLVISALYLTSCGDVSCAGAAAAPGTETETGTGRRTIPLLPLLAGRGQPQTGTRTLPGMRCHSYPKTSGGPGFRV
jgi:hypothetical protein